MRQTKEEYLMSLAEQVSTRATCKKRKVGCVIARDGRILTAGYNGSPSGMPHCEDAGCELENKKCVRCIHAELNAICQAAKFGINIDGGELFCTDMPCYSCAKAIAQCGIISVYAMADRKEDARIKKLFKKKNIVLIINGKMLSNDDNQSTIEKYILKVK